MIAATARFLLCYTPDSTHTLYTVRMDITARLIRCLTTDDSPRLESSIYLSITQALLSKQFYCKGVYQQLSDQKDANSDCPTRQLEKRKLKFNCQPTVWYQSLPVTPMFMTTQKRLPAQAQTLLDTRQKAPNQGGWEEALLICYTYIRLLSPKKDAVTKV